MKPYALSSRGVQLRFLVALLMVFATYNPHGWSYLHWLLAATSGNAIVGLPLLILAGGDWFHYLPTSDPAFTGSFRFVPDGGIFCHSDLGADRHQLRCCW